MEVMQIAGEIEVEVVEVNTAGEARKVRRSS
jgi:hypothetical protein